MSGGDDRALLLSTRLVFHTLMAKSLMYLSAILFSIISAISLLCSFVLSVCAHTIWSVTQINIVEAKLSAEACDLLERELIESTMVTGKHIQNDWQVVNVSTFCGLVCTMRLHSIIYTEENSDTQREENSEDNDHSGSSIRGQDHTSGTFHRNTVDEKNTSIENESDNFRNNDGGSYPHIKKNGGTNCFNNITSMYYAKKSEYENSSADLSEVTNKKKIEKLKKNPKNDHGGERDSKIVEKPVLLWLHGAGGTATLSLGISGIIDRLVDEYDIYALDLPGFGRSTIHWKDKKTKLADVSGKQNLLKFSLNIYIVFFSFLTELFIIVYIIASNC